MDLGLANDKLLASFCYEPAHLVGPRYGTAWVGHINFAYYLISEMQPKIIVELGTHGGASYFAFCESIRNNRIKAQAYAVDTWQGEAHAGAYTNEVYEYVAKTNLDNFSDFSTLIRQTFETAAEGFSKNSIDLLHIDGFHSYEAVLADYNTYKDRVSDRGIILFHDTHEKREGFGVHRFWSEMKNTYPDQCFEFSHSHGLGIFFKSDDAMHNYQDLVLSLKDERIKAVFQKIGMFLYQKYNRKMNQISLSDLQSILLSVKKTNPKIAAKIVELML